MFIAMRAGWLGLLAWLLVSLVSSPAYAEPTEVPGPPGGSSLVALQPPLLTPPAVEAVEQESQGSLLLIALEENRRWELIGGAGFILAVPFLDNNRALTVTMPAPNGQTLTQSTDFGNTVSVAPRFWLGIVSPSGWGFRTSYWHFDQSSSLATSVAGGSPTGTSAFSASPLGLGVATGTALLAPGNADVLTASSSLNLNAFDFEVIKEMEVGRVFLLLSTGGRFAQIGQHYNATVANTANNLSTNAEIDQLLSHQRLSGGGPTLALQGWYPLGGTRFSLYATARGTILFGSNRVDAATTTLRAVDGIVTLTPAGSVSGSHSSAVPIGELEVGLQWTGTWGRFYPFFRTGVVAQTWLDALTASTVSSVGGDSLNLNTNLSFFGVAFQAGLSY